MSSNYDLTGVELSSPHSMAFTSNGIPVLYPGASVTMEFISGAGFQLAPSAKSTRVFALQKNPTFPSAHLLGDLALDTDWDSIDQTNFGRDIWQLGSITPQPQGSGQASITMAWRKIGVYTSPADTSSALTLNGGTSDDVEAAIVECGVGGVLLLTGEFTLTRPIRLEGIFATGQRLTIAFDNLAPMFVGTDAVSISSQDVGPTPVINKRFMSNGAYLTSSPFNSNWWEGQIVSASFVL